MNEIERPYAHSFESITQELIHPTTTPELLAEAAIKIEDDINNLPKDSLLLAFHNNQYDWREDDHVVAQQVAKAFVKHIHGVGYRAYSIDGLAAVLRDNNPIFDILFLPRHNTETLRRYTLDLILGHSIQSARKHVEDFERWSDYFNNGEDVILSIGGVEQHLRASDRETVEKYTKVQQMLRSRVSPGKPEIK